ncbi:ribosome maturation factor RimM [Acidithiobacillus sp. AMEEHan]|uniref:ribosome maturation factor RimM n=1 Tax=Acidithiobacillus sp. AMEEHan TaxID=2994951 RepID=UPI0027E59464|nr:ribosome maturation factor RimM [Acidithiobacillus sp. AMEEHan]
MSTPPESAEWVPLGRISGLYGVRGAVKVFSYTEERDGILDHPRWYLGAAHRPVDVLSGGVQAGAVIALLQGVGDREAARALIGQEITVPAEALPPLPEGEYYWRELIGMQVINRAGQRLGQVQGLLETGANDVLVVQSEPSGEILIPWTADVQVDAAQRRMVVDWEKDW